MLKVAVCVMNLRVVQATKEGRINRLQNEVASLTTDYQKERAKAESNARLVAKMHREVEYWKAQVGSLCAPHHIALHSMPSIYVLAFQM
eukprot:scaffold354817_cov20-Prasinocladus_malaysianus.AAC.1